jgi:hypothetical protein
MSMEYIAMRMNGKDLGYEEVAYYTSSYGAGKMSVGLTDNLLLSVVRASDTTGEIGGSKKRRIVLATAMNTAVEASSH